ncbi:hypothetical protein FRB94_010278 [Tulasnella sp. JGI-2019a]|nr:hypothetical protein FRB94_010278 [Tulasnella sp. JGI-2019a]
MEQLSKPTAYDFNDSNIALLGGDIEKRVREQAGEHEPAWKDAELGKTGLLIWRVEKFKIQAWPKDRYGEFFDGDSYIVLYTYKKRPDSAELSYDLHFWLGEQTSQDEAGTAVYKTAELDDVLGGKPVQYREVMNYESHRFLSHFKRFVVQRGGIATGFHHVTSPPPEETLRLYRVHAEVPVDVPLPHGKDDPPAHALPVKTPVIVREVDLKSPNVFEGGDVYILDKGNEIWQLNTTGAVGKEKFKGAEFARTLADHTDRKGRCEVQVFGKLLCISRSGTSANDLDPFLTTDQGSTGATKFYEAIGHEPTIAPHAVPLPPDETKLFRLSDKGGAITFEQVEPASGGQPTIKDLSPSDAFLLDCSSIQPPVVFVWIGSQSSTGERRMALQYAQKHLSENGLSARTSIVKVAEGAESESFLKALGA